MEFLLRRRLKIIRKFIEDKSADKLTQGQVNDHKRHLARIEKMIRNKRE